MTYKSALGMLAVALAVVGCGADCTQLCDDSKKCAGASDQTKATDCEKTCTESAGCESQYETALSCKDDHDVCGYDDSCKTEIQALVTCMTK